MRSVSLLSLISAVAPLASAITLHKRDVPAVVELPIERRQNTGALRKRDSSVNVSLTNEVPILSTDQSLKLTEPYRGKLATC
jgi:hypothetical protein